MRKIIGIGETILDVIFKNDKPQDAVPGGSAFNALISLGRTLPKIAPEIQIKMVTSVGDDHIGDIILSFMKDNGVGTEYVTRVLGARSHASMAFLDDNNDAQYVFYKDQVHTCLNEDFLSRIEFNRDDIVLFGSFFAINPVIRKYTSAILERAHSAGAILYYDINFRKSHIKDLPDTIDFIRENFALSDFVRGSGEDFVFLFGTDDGRLIYKEIEPYCKNLILTRGPEPVEVYQKDNCRKFPVAHIQPLSTIGAGDNFNAGFVYSLIKYGITGARCGSLKHSEWEDIINVAGQFSSASCLSFSNYVNKDFVVR